MSNQKAIYRWIDKKMKNRLINKYIYNTNVQILRIRKIDVLYIWKSIQIDRNIDGQIYKKVDRLDMLIFN